MSSKYKKNYNNKRKYHYTIDNTSNYCMCNSNKYKKQKHFKKKSCKQTSNSCCYCNKAINGCFVGGVIGAATGGAIGTKACPPETPVHALIGVPADIVNGVLC